MYLKPLILKESLKKFSGPLEFQMARSQSLYLTVVSAYSEIHVIYGMILKTDDSNTPE